MNFEQLKQAWQQLGASDPRWAILSEPGRKGGGGDDASFWESGIGFVRWLAQHLECIGALPARNRALDFGCGHGRLTQALAPHFDQVVGVDIADSMLAAARLANKHGEKVTYVHNTRPDLAVFPDASFDFVLTMIVLQHMRPEYAAVYMREFLRILRPGGIAFFQIPIEPLAPRPDAKLPRAATAAPVSSPQIHCSTSIVPGRLAVVVGSWLWIRVDVHNSGASTLHAASGIEVGARFQRLDETVATAPMWAPLPHDIPAGGRASVLLAVQAPPMFGNYILTALPAVGRSWFLHPRNVAAATPVRVAQASSARPVETAPPPRPGYPDPNPKQGQLIEVYGTPLEEVTAIVTGAGGEVVEVGLDGWAGHVWVSAHLTVRKR